LAALLEVAQGAGSEPKGVIGLPPVAVTVPVEMPAVAGGGQAEPAPDLGLDLGEPVDERQRMGTGAAAGGDVDQPAVGRVGGGDH
jgi:hypothetical protein